MNLIVNTSQVTQGSTGERPYGVAITSVTVTTVSSAQPLSIDELAHACGADAAWINELIALGLIGVEALTPEGRWHFQSADLQCALEVRRLQRDFDVGLDAAALILDLQHEVRRLKAALQAHERLSD